MLAVNIAPSVHKLGVNRGRPRVWLDGKRLTLCGFSGGTHYACLMHKGQISLAVVSGVLPEGWHWRKVTGRPDGKPIIDLTGADVGASLGDCENVTVTWKWGRIVVRPAKEG